MATILFYGKPNSVKNADALNINDFEHFKNPFAGFCSAVASDEHDEIRVDNLNYSQIVKIMELIEDNDEEIELEVSEEDGNVNNEYEQKLANAYPTTLKRLIKKMGAENEGEEIKFEQSDFPKVEDHKISSVKKKGNGYEVEYRKRGLFSLLFGVVQYHYFDENMNRCEASKL